MMMNLLKPIVFGSLTSFVHATVKEVRAGAVCPHSTMYSVLALHPVVPGLTLGVPKNFSLNVAEIY